MVMCIYIYISFHLLTAHELYMNDNNNENE